MRNVLWPVALLLPLALGNGDDNAAGTPVSDSGGGSDATKTDGGGDGASSDALSDGAASHGDGGDGGVPIEDATGEGG